MALTSPSLFLYGFQVTVYNRSIDFKIVSLGVEKQATLTLGFYSLTTLTAEIKRAMQAVDPTHTYTVTADRTVSGGTQNRVTIATTGPFLSLLFATGTRSATSVSSLIGFAATDRTGSTSYTGTFSAGTKLITNMTGYNFLSPELMRKNAGTLNVSSSGKKEAVVFSTQKFWQAQFKYIPYATASVDWTALMTWMIAQRPLEFTPNITSPSSIYDGTLESTSDDGKGLGYKLTEMLPQFPNLYDTGLMKFRVRN